MSIPTDRKSLTDYALRQLGFPVITINVDPDQLDDRIDDVFTLYQQFHMDATTTLYLSVTADANIVSNTANSSYHCFQMPNTVIGVTRVFPVLAATGSTMGTDFNIFDLNYQLRLNELYDFTSADYVYFELAQQHIRTLEMLFIGEPPIRFNRHDGIVYVDQKWNEITVGTKFVFETFSIVPQSNKNIWNDTWIKEYTIALFKLQWGNNLKKFKGTKLPGGVELDGQSIYSEAVEEKDRLEKKLRDMYELPPDFIIG